MAKDATQHRGKNDQRLCGRCGCPWHTLACASQSHASQSCPAAVTIGIFQNELLSQISMQLAENAQLLRKLVANTDPERSRIVQP